MEDGKWNRIHHPSVLLGSRGEIRQVAVPSRPLIQRFPQADFWTAWFSRGSTSGLLVIRQGSLEAMRSLITFDKRTCDD